MDFRLIRRADFPVCARLLHPAFKVSAKLRAALPGLWHRLLSGGQLNGGVVVDRSGPGRSPIAAFGMTAFVTDAFVDEYLASPKPYLSAIVYERLLSGDAPVLDARQVGRANTSGSLNLLILHFGTGGPTPTDARTLTAVAAAQDGFRLTHVGYRIRRVLQEGYGPQQLAFLTQGGFVLKSDYGDYYADARRQKPRAEDHPYFVGLDRDDPEGRLPGTPLSSLFHTPVPRFRFSTAEQRVLARAVMDEGDDDVADALGVTDDAVKKTWRRVYERVAAVDPDLLGGIADRSGLTRGKEKRRRLVRHLRFHLEELRPYTARPHLSPSRRKQR